MFVVVVVFNWVGGTALARLAFIIRPVHNVTQGLHVLYSCVAVAVLGSSCSQYNINCALHDPIEPIDSLNMPC